MAHALCSALVLMLTVVCSAPHARGHLWASSSAASTSWMSIVSINPVTGAFSSSASINGGSGFGTDDLAGDPFWQGGTLWGVRRGTTASYLAAWNPVANTFLRDAPIDTPTLVRTLAIDPTNGRFYGTTDTGLYTIDPHSGHATLIGTTTGMSVEKALAFNRAGQLFGVGMGNKLVSIDKASGATVSIATLNVNRIEGMAWDSETDAMFAYGYNPGPLSYSLFTVDLTGGALTHIGSTAGRQSGLAFTGLAADFDSDGTVTLQDLEVWKTHVGFLATNRAHGDANGDGAVDGADYLAWQRQLGSTIVPPAVVAEIPEPSALVIGFCGMMAAIAVRSCTQATKR